MALPRLSFNSPVILTLSLAAVLVLVLDRFLLNNLIPAFFTLNSRQLDLLSAARLFTYPLGHQNWGHLAGNLTYLLLLGPALEERHGGRWLLMMMALTVVASGLVSIWLLGTGLLGASGIVCMLLILTSFANSRAGTIPLTFVLIAPLFVANEVASALRDDNVSQFAHLMGGVFGAAFGWWRRRS